MGILDLFGRDKTQAAAARRHAEELRRLYGDEAELWCEAGAYGADDPAARRHFREVRKALEELPAAALH